MHKAKQERRATHLNTFFVHLTRTSPLPLRVKSAFSMIRIAGNSCSGTESMIARE
jgi:hypothetical protein